MLSGRNPIGQVETSYKFDLDEETMTIQGFYFLKDNLETKKYPVNFNFQISILLKIFQECIKIDSGIVAIVRPACQSHEKRCPGPLQN